MHSNRSITRRSLLGSAAGVGAASVLPAGSWAQAGFPNKPIRLVVPFTPGGVTDTSGRVVADYLSSFLASESGQRQINRRNKGGVKAGLNFDDIRSIVVLLPPPELQRAFATAKRRLRRLGESHERALASENDLFHSLVSSAFSTGVSGRPNPACRSDGALARSAL